MTKLKQFVTDNRTRIFWALVTVSVLVSLALFAFSVRRYGWAWTGFVHYTTPKSDTEEFHPGKTLWDFMQLLIIPLVLVVGGFLLNRAQRQQELDIAAEEREAERKIARDREEERALQSYLEAMTELLLENKLRTPEEGSEVVSIARARTLTILRSLSGERKSSILRFLYEAELIDSEKTVIALMEANLEGANLMGAYLVRANLEGANLKRANLVGANLMIANLMVAKLVGANLEGAFLTEANLEEANLVGANLVGANLVGANLERANLEGANLMGANLVGDNLVGANLMVAKLVVAKLVGANLMGADLMEANLVGANLERANLEGANLMGADLMEANLIEANLMVALIDADLEGANLEGANLMGANLERANLEGAKYNDATKWPEDFTPPPEAINLDKEQG